MAHQLHGVRVLTPAEYENLIEQITKPSLKLLVAVLLLTGMRYEEVLRLKQFMRPDEYNAAVDEAKKNLKPGQKSRFDASSDDHDKPVLFIDDNHIWIRSGKKKAKSPERNVPLTDAGKKAVREFIEDDRFIYPSANNLSVNLTQWAVSAGFEPLNEHQIRDMAGMNRDKIRKNVYGMSVKSFRKTWENWLLTICPERVFDIMKSQGHDVQTSSEHYAGAVFSGEDIEKIRAYVQGWKPSSHSSGVTE